MRKFAQFAAAIGILAIILTGCALESPLSIRRVWGDYNTLKTPALFYDTITHLPPDSLRVNEWRWMYNKGPHELSPHPLIPDPQGVTPLPGSHDETVPVGRHELGPPVPQPPSAVPPDNHTTPAPPLPGKAGIAPSSGPVAERALPMRTARPDGTWRFIH